MLDVPERGFSIDEFVRRLAAIQSQMSAQGIGALLLTTEHDIFYFSGFPMPRNTQKRNKKITKKKKKIT